MPYIKADGVWSLITVAESVYSAVRYNITQSAAPDDGHMVARNMLRNS
jgi:hypothetical protein